MCTDTDYSQPGIDRYRAYAGGIRQGKYGAKSHAAAGQGEAGAGQDKDRRTKANATSCI